MTKKNIFLLCFCVFLFACSTTQKKDTQQNSYPAKVQNFAKLSSVFKVELDEKLGEGSSLLLSIDYDKQDSFYTIKVLGAFASVLLKVKYDLDTFTYDYKPAFLENQQVKELFEQTTKVLIGDQYLSNYSCTSKQCILDLGSEMFRNKYTFSSYNEQGFAKDIVCSYRRGVVKIKLELLKVK